MIDLLLRAFSLSIRKDLFGKFLSTDTKIYPQLAKLFVENIYKGDYFWLNLTNEIYKKRTSTNDVPTIYLHHRVEEGASIDSPSYQYIVLI